MPEVQEDFRRMTGVKKVEMRRAIAGPVHRGMTNGQTQSNILGESTSTELFINIRQEITGNFHRLMKTGKGKTEDEKKSRPMWPALPLKDWRIQRHGPDWPRPEWF